MLLKDKDSSRSSFRTFSQFFYFDSSLGLQSDLPRRGSWLIELTSLFFWKFWKFLKLFKWKTFALLGLYVVLKGIVSSFLVVFGCLKTSRGIFLAFSVLACMSDLWYFCSSNVFFQLFKAFFFYIFILNNETYPSFEREWYILLKNVVGGLT